MKTSYRSIFTLLILYVTSLLSNANTPYDIRSGGGFFVGILSLPIDPLNEALHDNNFEGLSAGVIVFGGSGVVGRKAGNRIGGFGAGGTISSVSSEKQAILELSYGGFLYERGIWTSQRLDIALGAVAGGGGMRLNLVHQTAGKFDDILAGTNTEGAPLSSFADNGFLMLIPRVNMHIRLYKVIGLDINLGYIFTQTMGSNTWSTGNSGITNGPFKNWSGLQAGLQLSFGL